MNNFRSRLKLGRAHVAALSLVLLSVVIAGTSLSQARAQGGMGQGKVSMRDFYFGPLALEPINPNLPLTSESVEVGLLLPAVQKVREAASRMQVIGNGFMLDLPVFAQSTPSIANYRIWMERSTQGSGFILNVQAPGGEVRRMPIEVRELTIRVQPALQSDHKVIEVESASARHHTLGRLVQSDVGPEPILIGMLIPAIQKVR